MVECVEIEVGHQVSFYIIHRFSKRLDEFIEVFFIQEYLMPVIAIIIKPFPALSDGKIVVVTTGSPDVKKIGPSFPSPDPLAVNTFHFLFVVVVRHSLSRVLVNKSGFL